MEQDRPLAIENIKSLFLRCNLVPSDRGVTFHGMYSPQELWEYREYSWSRSSAGDGGTDKWNFVPDTMGRVGNEKWDAMKAKLQKEGWNEKDPAHFEMGENGVMKVGEGNHRLAIAMEIGIDVPVFFHFKDEVHLSPMSNR